MSIYIANPSRVNNRLNWHRLYNNSISQEAGLFIPVDVMETEKAYQVTAPLPGLRVEDLEIEIEGDLLTLKGEIKGQDDEEVRFLVKERSAGSFSRKLRLPVALNAEKSEASLKNGVLTLHIPKAENALPKKIQINMN